MADKQLTFDEEARASLMRGVDELKRVVGITLWPSGRNVLLSRMFGLPIVCSDGVTVAKEVELEEPYENLGAQLVKEAASKTNDAVGDGKGSNVLTGADPGAPVGGAAFHDNRVWIRPH